MRNSENAADSKKYFGDLLMNILIIENREIIFINSKIMSNSKQITDEVKKLPNFNTVL